MGGWVGGCGCGVVCVGVSFAKTGNNDVNAIFLLGHSVFREESIPVSPASVF